MGRLLFAPHWLSGANKEQTAVLRLIVGPLSLESQRWRNEVPSYSTMLAGILSSVISKTGPVEKNSGQASPTAQYVIIDVFMNIIIITIGPRPLGFIERFSVVTK